MAKLKLKSKDIRAIGYPEGPVISIAMNVMEKKFKFEKEDYVMNLLKSILASPVEYENDAVLGLIAQQLLPKTAPEGMEISLNKTGIGFNIFGNEQIGPEAINQMYQAAKLPIAVAGALMPDAHSGYGLPIGGRRPIARVENHHNFAWKEFHEGRELVVPRKGATPAGKDVLGIIPGSMTAKGYIVKGKGEVTSISSAAHGAGRKMSRAAAANSITHELLKDTLKQYGVKLLGGGLDEAPQAYKNIGEVMRSQGKLVDTIGLFTPKIVRMDG